MYFVQHVLVTYIHDVVVVVVVVVICCCCLFIVCMSPLLIACVYFYRYCYNYMITCTCILYT